jgi:glycine/D-amino acid oxidase-like deaminating enzyme
MDSVQKKKNRSPWIHQLDGNRQIVTLNTDIETDIAVVGAGIAGVSTSFFLLTNTDKKIVLIEGNRLAHGATGHNAGQVTSYFERPLSDIAKEFGKEMTKEAQYSIESAWELMDHIYTTAGLDIPFSRFTGHAGIVSLERVVQHLGDNQTRKDLGLTQEEFLIADNAPFLKDLPREYKDLYKVVPQSEILEKLETKNTEFYACISAQKGCINSALFCQEVITYLLKQYSDRFSLYEHTHVIKVVLHNERAILDCANHTVQSSRVILCTNGFKNIALYNESGLEINTRFHHKLGGLIGFMSGYLEKHLKPPTAISYILPKGHELDGDYYYLTRRQYEYETEPVNLISVGGPEMILEDGGEYASEIDYPEKAAESIDEFVRSVYENDKEKKINYEFQWHGLMGYTSNGVRLIGEEPKNPVLLYNLGCNGIGILPSIYGGKRISQIISGEKLPPSIFDPRFDTQTIEANNLIK